MSYLRVVPRDLFNEAKLLKCLGKLSLNILDSVQGVAPYLEEVFQNHDLGFAIVQNEHDGSLSSATYNVYLKSDLDNPIHLYTPLNCKEPWPLMYELDADVVNQVFNDEGNFTKEFIDDIRRYSNE